MNQPGLADVRCVLFDAVGTLIFPDPDVVSVYRSFGATIGSARTHDQIRESFAAAYHQQFETAHPDCATSESMERSRWFRLVRQVFDDIPVSEPQFDLLWKHFADPEHWSLFPDVAPVIRELQTDNCLIAVASNFDCRLRGILSALLADESPDLFISTEIGWSKPQRQFFQAIQERLLRRRIVSRPNQVLLVGDSTSNDIIPAIEFGWKACLIDRSGNATTNAGIVIQQLTQIVELRQRP